ncbi:hypothetical protein ACKWTF_002204 [Chironomus riparius]
MCNTLPVIGVIYYTMITNIKKSLLINSDLLPKFTTIESNRRSNGTLEMKNFKRKNRIGIEASYLGIKLFNRLPEELRNIKKLYKLKFHLKKYLLCELDLLLSDEQLISRKISRVDG